MIARTHALLAARSLVQPVRDHPPDGEDPGRVAGARYASPSRCVRRLTLRTLARSQIKVRDLSNMSVTASPADYNSWEAVRNELMSEAKKGLKARVEAEVAAAKEDDDLEAMKLAFQGEERDLEHSIDHEVHTFSCVLDIDYNFLSK